MRLNLICCRCMYFALVHAHCLPIIVSTSCEFEIAISYIQCICRNETVGWCQCEKDEWRGVQKGVWNAVMSPYETRYVDVRINGEISGSVIVAIEEG